MCLCLCLHSLQGLAYIDSWGNLRYVANQAFMGLLHNKMYPDKGQQAAVYTCFARKQARIMLGDAGTSYVVSCRIAHSQSPIGSWGSMRTIQQHDVCGETPFALRLSALSYKRCHGTAA